MLILALTCAVFSVYRLAFMIAREEGPFDVFDRLRALAGNLPPDVARDGFTSRTRSHWIQRGLGCPLCVSWWLALPAAFIVVYSLSQPPLMALALWPCIAGICLFLYQLGGT